MNTPNTPQFVAGFRTAQADFRRLSSDALDRVPQPNDNPDWVAGFRAAVAQCRAAQ